MVNNKYIISVVFCWSLLVLTFGKCWFLLVLVGRCWNESISKLERLDMQNQQNRSLLVIGK